MTQDNELIKQIDKKIAETEALAAEAQKWANQLGSLQNNVLVLKRARLLLLGEETPGEPREDVPVFPNPSQPALNLGSDVSSNGNGSQPASIGSLLIGVLMEAGSPLKVQRILERMRAKGRTDVTGKTLGGVISQYLTKGSIRRTARATYALPRANRTEMHTG